MFCFHIKYVYFYIVLDIKSSRLTLSKLDGKRGAGGRTRTGTLSPAVDFESTTSANSITPACDLIDNTIRHSKNQVKISVFIKSFDCLINHINVVLRYNLKRCVHRKHGNADINYIHAEVCKIHSNRSAAA